MQFEPLAQHGDVIVEQRAADSVLRLVFAVLSTSPRRLSILIVSDNPAAGVILRLDHRLDGFFHLGQPIGDLGRVERFVLSCEVVPGKNLIWRF